MSLIEKVKSMFGAKPKPKSRAIDPLQAQVATAVERHEQANQEVQQALEEFKLTATVREISGRMK